MAKISIITICYNEPNLEKTCESIVNQTFQDFEWIVVDGGSNQETQEIWNRYKDRIDKFISEPEKGIYNACNKGISLATGEYLNFMNAGDYFTDKNVLQNVVKNDLENILYSDVYLFYKSESDKYKLKKNPRIVKNAKFFMHSNLYTQAMIIPKKFFTDYGYFNEKYKIASDRDRWICFAINGAKFKYINTPIAVYNMDGLSSQSNRDFHVAEINQILQQYFSKEEIEKNIIHYTFWEHLFSVKNSIDRTQKIISVIGIKFKIKILGEKK